MQLLIALPILLFSAILHEVAHGFVADRLGDPTARLSGRLTLNPLKHIDPYWTILLPLLLLFSGLPIIGGAKPVPIDPFNLREGKKDMAIISLVGPLTNILIAIAAAIVIKLTGFSLGIEQTLIAVILYKIVELNLLLAIFNLLPIPPLDGSKIFALVLPEPYASRYLALGTFGLLIIFLLISFPLGNFSLIRFMITLLSFSFRVLGLPTLF